MDYVGIGVLIAAIAAAVVSIINAINTPRQINAVSTKVDGVHEIVNSQRSQMQEEIRGLNQQVAELHKILRPAERK